MILQINSTQAIETSRIININDASGTVTIKSSADGGTVESLVVNDISFAELMAIIDKAQPRRVVR